mgnify:FL=1
MSVVKIIPNNVYDFGTKKQLNPELWENSKLKEETREALLEIAEEFIDFLKIYVKPTDIQFTGSLANFNYTRYSDVDLHILIDFSDIDENTELVEEYLKSKKIIWNDKHAIAIKGYEVEIYPQNSEEEHHSTGVYSILNDEWVVEPSYEDISPNISDIRKKASDIANEIKSIVLEPDMDRIDRVKDKIMKMRKSGLESEGEYSVENLAFKVLRRKGLLGKLNQVKRELYDKKFSLDEELVI